MLYKQIARYAVEDTCPIRGVHVLSVLQQFEGYRLHRATCSDGNGRSGGHHLVPHLSRYGENGARGFGSRGELCPR